jgi:protein gp37
MSLSSSIEWTQSTWNPLTGCTKISLGCCNCYAERMALRLKAMRNPNYQNGFELTMHRQSLDLPLTWKKPQRIFVNSMSDLFHEKASDEFILKIFDIMNRANWHQYQILTKRTDRLLAMNSMLPWKSNVWMGVTVEKQNYVCRIDNLRKTKAKIKFVSFEPLLGPIPNINLSGIDWVIVGGESGPNSRPIEKSWVIEIRNKCEEKKIPFFFKQWGGLNKKKAGRQLEGRTWDEMPSESNLSIFKFD